MRARATRRQGSAYIQENIRLEELRINRECVFSMLPHELDACECLTRDS